MNWDDLKIFLCVARHRKLAAAARELKLDETTISRRLKRLEDTLGHRLFERLRSGHHLTQYGQALLATAEEIELQTAIIQAPQAPLSQSPSGTIRISVAEGFGVFVLSPCLGAFHKKYPQIEIDLVAGSGFLSLSRREADIAIGLSRPKSAHIISELLCKYDLHLYAHSDYLAQHEPIKSPIDLSGHLLIDYVDDLIYAEELRYFETALPQLRPGLRSTSITAQRNLVKDGTGLAILPDFMTSDDLVKVLPGSISLSRQFWFSVHKTIAPLAKIQAFKAFIFEYLSKSATLSTD